MHVPPTFRSRAVSRAAVPAGAARYSCYSCYSARAGARGPDGALSFPPFLLPPRGAE